MVQVFTIRDLEELSGVPRTTIHYYLRHGLLPRPQKTAASRSLYTEQHLKILKGILELKDAGKSLLEIEAELQHHVDEANEAVIDLAAQEYQRVHNSIMALSAREFSVKGYKNTHISHIMRELGITASVFYTHFPSKRQLLAECVSVLVSWGLQYVDSKHELIRDPAEHLLWLVYAHSRVFEFGSAALALTRVEGVQDDDDDLSKPIEEGLVGIVQRIMGDIAQVSRRQRHRPLFRTSSWLTASLVRTSKLSSARSQIPSTREKTCFGLICGCSWRLRRPAVAKWTSIRGCSSTRD